MDDAGDEANDAADAEPGAKWIQPAGATLIVFAGRMLGRRWVREREQPGRMSERRASGDAKPRARAHSRMTDR